jgi:ribosomal protein S18 acetylase RimI-like enzyme
VITTASWQDAAPDDLAAAFAVETERWRDALDWDTKATWTRVEAARRDGRMTGVVTRSSDARLSGWACWAARGDEVHCGTITAATAAETSAIVAALAADADRLGARRTVLFAFSAAPGLVEALGRHGFAVGDYEFLSGSVAADPSPRVPAGRPWDLRDFAATADLLRAAYPAGDWLRPFAPTGTADAWGEYVHDLVLADGCGRFRPSLSRIVPAARDGADAVALVTDLGHGSAHLAQLAVRPSAVRRGLGRALVSTVRDACARARFTRLTLLVSGTNDPARHLYRALGFEHRARFVAATRQGARWQRAAS